MKEIEVEETEQDTTLSAIVDRAIRKYYKDFYSEDAKNKEQIPKGQTKINC